jgi:hypothetical protein
MAARVSLDYGYGPTRSASSLSVPTSTQRTPTPLLHGPDSPYHDIVTAWCRPPCETLGIWDGVPRASRTSYERKRQHEVGRQVDDGQRPDLRVGDLVATQGRADCTPDVPSSLRTGRSARRRLRWLPLREVRRTHVDDGPPLPEGQLMSAFVKLLWSTRTRPKRGLTEAEVNARLFGRRASWRVRSWR